MSEPMKPMEIEQRSFEIITELLGNRVLDPENELVIKRVIHTTADFDYADNLTFSDHAVQKGIAALKGVREEQVFIGNGSDEAIGQNVAPRTGRVD